MHDNNDDLADVTIVRLAKDSTYTKKVLELLGKYDSVKIRIDKTSGDIINVFSDEGLVN